MAYRAKYSNDVTQDRPSSPMDKRQVLEPLMDRPANPPSASTKRDSLCNRPASNYDNGGHLSEDAAAAMNRAMGRG